MLWGQVLVTASRLPRLVTCVVANEPYLKPPSPLGMLQKRGVVTLARALALAVNDQARADARALVPIPDIQPSGVAHLAQSRACLPASLEAHAGRAWQLHGRCCTHVYLGISIYIYIYMHVCPVAAAVQPCQPVTHPLACCLAAPCIMRHVRVCMGLQVRGMLGLSPAYIKVRGAWYARYAVHAASQAARML